MRRSILAFLLVIPCRMSSVEELDCVARINVAQIGKHVKNYFLFFYLLLRNFSARLLFMKAELKKPKFRPTNIRMPGDLHSRARILAAKLDMSLSTLLIALIREALQARSS